MSFMRLPPPSAGALPIALPILSFSSRTTLAAVLAPTPLAFAIDLASPDITAPERRCGVSTERIAIAAFGPTPETEIRSSKAVFSSSLAKPKSSIASSRTEKYVKSFAGEPSLPARAEKVFDETVSL